MSDLVFPYFLEYYDKQVVTIICEKSSMNEFEALRRFIKSKTYEMLCDKNFEMWYYGYPAIFNIWESEQITGDPRNSSYIKGI